MKELSIEEKAKAYDEAIEVAREYWNSPRTCIDIDVLPELFPEIKEIDDEEIREAMIKYFTNGKEYLSLTPYSREDYIAWLEKQGEHAKFRDSIQVGDKVTRNQDGVLVNLSQLNRVAKKDEKQGDDKVEQKPWSEEDEQLYNDLSDTYFYNDEDYPEETYKLMLKRVLDWMTKRAKSLRPQNTWKPSKEQLYNK